MTATKKNNKGPILPGRLGDPNATFETDPRADPRMVAALKPLGYAGVPPAAPVTAQSPLKDILAFLLVMEKGTQEMLEEIFKGLPPLPVEHSVEETTGVDGNTIKLYVSRPKGVSGKLPCIYHIHGGGMVVQTAQDADYVRWRDELAALGMVVVGVEFRNGGGELGDHPFPAGLNDCMSGLEWTYQNKEALQADKIVVSGESGGGNLSLAVGIRAKKQGKLEMIDGIFSMCPYISGAYGDRPPRLESMWECEDYFFNTGMLAAMVKVYDPDGKNAQNPEAWPYWAKPEDVEGFPPTVISVSELDPLRTEGLVFYQTLKAAKVVGFGRTVTGICHAGDVILRKAMPDVYHGTTRAIHAFATSL